MVGNDPVNDMVAAHTGIKTYLTNDSKDSWKIKVDVDGVLQGLQLEDIPEPDFKGSLSELPHVVQRSLESQK